MQPYHKFEVVKIRSRSQSRWHSTLKHDSTLAHFWWIQRFVTIAIFDFRQLILTPLKRCLLIRGDHIEKILNWTIKNRTNKKAGVVSAGSKYFHFLQLFEGKNHSIRRVCNVWQIYKMATSLTTIYQTYLTKTNIFKS